MENAEILDIHLEFRQKVIQYLPKGITPLFCFSVEKPFLSDARKVELILDEDPSIRSTIKYIDTGTENNWKHDNTLRGYQTPEAALFAGIKVMVSSYSKNQDRSVSAMGGDEEILNTVAEANKLSGQIFQFRLSDHSIRTTIKTKVNGLEVRYDKSSQLFFVPNIPGFYPWEGILKIVRTLESENR